MVFGCVEVVVDAEKARDNFLPRPSSFCNVDNLCDAGFAGLMLLLLGLRSPRGNALSL